MNSTPEASARQKRIARANAWREGISRALLVCAGLAAFTWLFYYLFRGALPQIVPWFSQHSYLLIGFAVLVVILSLTLLIIKLTRVCEPDTSDL